MCHFPSSRVFRAETRQYGRNDESETMVMATIASTAKQLAEMPPESYLCFPMLAPSSDLLAKFTSGKTTWHDFARLYSQELRVHSSRCQHLRSIACQHGIAFLCEANNPQESVEAALINHLEMLECENRWDAGFMIGGFVYPVLEQIQRAGGLWFARHKAWVMPDRQSWKYVQSLLPGEF